MLKIASRLFSTNVSKKIIKNVDVASCRNCIYHKSNMSIINYEFASHLSRCSKFGNKNIINNQITYDYAENCRSVESKCGEKGKHFEEDKNIDTKILINRLVCNSPYILVGLSVIASLQKMIQ
jgi:hypothetical protein